ncbi:peptidoglycan-binding domain-containing protein [Streptomyces sp. NPDC094049]|uniref:peptidoglycan-binding domain-containing protein n=1 Tax=Streptomyces sp. NPDC094049 TaxID=3154987 RepID=UPI003334A19F
MAAAEDFDPLRIRPYVVLESPDSQGFPDSPEGTDGAGGAYGTGSLPAEDPPTTQLTAVRVGGGRPTAPYGRAPGGGGGHGGRGGSGGFDGQGGRGGLDGQGGGDPSETMPLLLRGVGDVPHAPVERRGRKRGVLIAAVAAVAVAGTAALAASVLGDDGTDDRAAVPEVTTSASLNVAVSEAPAPSSKTPEPSTTAPTARPTSASPSATPTPTASGTTTAPSATPTTAGTGAPSASPTSQAPVAPPTTAGPTGTPTPTSTPDEEAPTLSPGSSGPEVRELQRRLAAVGVYGGRASGRYDDDVQEAVELYQSYMYIQGDTPGVYGPHTRAVLERHTPYI